MTKIPFEIEINNKEYVPLVYDVARMLTIQVVIQFLYYVNTDGASFFSVDFFLLAIYVTLGVCVYWLIIKKLIVFK